MYIPASITRAGIGKMVRLPIPRTEQFKRSVYYNGCKIWNELKEEVKSLGWLKDFKKEKLLPFE